jgi:hypothetical protein
VPSCVEENLNMKSSFLIVVDRGNLKAFRVEKVPADRPPRVQLVQAISLADAHAKISEVNTDMAGRFPAGNSAHANGSGDRHYEIEGTRRCARQLAELITNILQEQHAENWAFAAPAEINQAVLDLLGAGLRKQVVENVQRDLVNLSPNDLLGHFNNVKAA